VREKWHEATTDVDAFMRDCTQFEPTATTSLEAIKEHYECWCLLKDKKRHVKQLQKKLKPLFRSTNQRNVYAVKLLEFRPETKNSELPKILVQNSEKAVFPMQAQL
jgi:hypothetical protein